MTDSETLRLLELFQARDYAQFRPHFYVRSPKSNKWVCPKGMRLMMSTQEIGILHWDTEVWESIPAKQVDFGLW